MQRARESRDVREWRDEEIARYESALERDPNNASFHALLAEKLVEAGRREEAIHEFRTAIGLSPHSPQTVQWKTHLRKTLETQAGRDTFNFTVCDNCEADMPVGTRVCTRCGNVMRMGFLEWVAKPENYRSIARQAAVPICIAIILFTVFSALSLEWKACVICACVIVGGWSFLRFLGGG